MEKTERLLSLFVDHTYAKPVFLLGAGASLKSGIPLSEQIVDLAVKWAFCRSNGKHPEDPSIRRSDWLDWVTKFAWYKRDVTAADNYSDVIHHLLNPREERREFFLRITHPAVPASKGYSHLLDLLDQRRIDTVLTTNFDSVLPDLHVTRMRPHVLDVIRTPSDYVKFSTSPIRPQLIYLHGSVEHYTDKNLLEEVQRLDEEIVSRLTHFLRDHPLVVIGYRGAEPSIMSHLLADQANKTNLFPKGIYWCVLKGGGTSLHPLVQALADKLKGNLQIIEIDGFDEALEKIAEHAGNLPRVPEVISNRARDKADAQLPFDLQLVRGASLDELDWTRAQSQITSYCRDMQLEVPSHVSREWLLRKMQELELLRSEDDRLLPTNAGYLLLAKDPLLRIPGACCCLRIDTLDTQITGNLWTQLEELQRSFDEVNTAFRLKGFVSETVYPYPRLALKELAVNALVHRQYDGGKPLVVEIDKHFIKFLNPGGLVPQVFRQVETNLQEKIELGFRGIRGYRNPVIADMFYGAGAMDKKGSGLPDVHSEVTRNDGKVFFGPLDENASFRALIYRRKGDIDSVTRTAALETPKSKYFANLLEVVGLPQYLWKAETRCRSAIDVYRNAQDKPVPPFAFRSQSAILTFADLSSPSNPFEPSITTESINNISATDLVVTPDGERLFVELLNRALYKFMEEKGLSVDADRKRCFFARTDSGPREIRYQASFRQATRTVTKPVISRTSDRVLYWEHEALWFGFERFGTEWALRVLPTYVFTHDGEYQLLHHSRVGALATRKSARDFNIQVFNDLVFWSWVFAGEKDFFEIALGDDQALTVRRALLTCELEVPPAELLLDADATRKLDQAVAMLEEELAEAAEADLAKGDDR